MKKILIISLLLILSSCSIDWSGEKDKKIAELEKQIQDDTFKKKQECLKLSDFINKNINLNNDKGIKKYELIEIFYSKKQNDCLWILREDFNSNNLMQTMYFLNKSGNLWIEGNIERCREQTYLDNPDNDNNNCDTFDKKIQELKGE